MKLYKEQRTIFYMLVECKNEFPTPKWSVMISKRGGSENIQEYLTCGKFNNKIKIK